MRYTTRFYQIFYEKTWEQKPRASRIVDCDMEKSQSNGSTAYGGRLAPKIWKQTRRLLKLSKIFIQQFSE